MADSKNLKEAFETSIKNGEISGMLIFSSQFISQFDVYKAIVEWSSEDKGVIYLALRFDQDNSHIVDFRYDEKQATLNIKPKSFIHDYLKPYFKEKLGDDYLKAWSVDRTAIIVK